MITYVAILMFNGKSIARSERRECLSSITQSTECYPIEEHLEAVDKLQLYVMMFRYKRTLGRQGDMTNMSSSVYDPCR